MAHAVARHEPKNVPDGHDHVMNQCKKHGHMHNTSTG